ncbi:MAG: type II toxin-antitoxin system RelE/ParE family toxin [Sterolibacterium sp.]
MAKKPIVKFTANFERNLEEIERFLTEAEAPKAFDGLLDELLETVIPNLERFPEMGRPFLRQRVRSVEVANAVAALKVKLTALTPETDAIREYVLKHYLMLYAVMGGTIYLLAIRHQRQLSFDFEGHWGS